MSGSCLVYTHCLLGSCWAWNASHNATLALIELHRTSGKIPENVIDKADKILDDTEPLRKNKPKIVDENRRMIFHRKI